DLARTAGRKFVAGSVVRPRCRCRRRAAGADDRTPACGPGSFHHAPVRLADPLRVVPQRRDTTPRACAARRGLLAAVSPTSSLNLMNNPGWTRRRSDRLRRANATPHATSSAAPPVGRVELAAAQAQPLGLGATFGIERADSLSGEGSPDTTKLAQ